MVKMYFQVFIVLFSLVIAEKEVETASLKKLDTPKTPYKLGIFTTYPPTICGIAQFSENMVKGFQKADVNMEIEIFNIVRSFPSPPRVINRLKTIDILCIGDAQKQEFKNLTNYVKASSFNGIIINHEFYLIGNFHYYIDLLKDLSSTGVPIYTILHTPTNYPSATRRSHITKVASLSKKVFVMSWKGKHYLYHAYGIPKSKIVYFPHGIKKMAHKKEVLNELRIPSDRFILYCDGIMHTEKGIERVIDALSILKQKNQLDNILLLVAGVNSKGGSYMQHISGLIQEKELTQHFMWIPKFLSDVEMSTLHRRANIYLTLFDEAIPTSGTLTYGMYSGDAIVSTPYRYSLELLGIDSSKKKELCIKRHEALVKEKKIYGNAGISIPFRKPDLLADAILDLKNNPELTKKLKKRAKQRVNGYSWNNVSAHIAHFLKTKKSVDINSDPYLFPLVPSFCSWNGRDIHTFFSASKVKETLTGHYLLYKDPFIKILADLVQNRIVHIEIKPARLKEKVQKKYSTRGILVNLSKKLKLLEKKESTFLLESPNIVFLVQYRKKDKSVLFVVLLENVHGCAFGLLGSTLRQKYDLTNPSIPSSRAFLMPKSKLPKQQ